MMSVVISPKLEVPITNSTNSFRNVAVWEIGYTVCLDVCRAVDSSDEKSNEQMQQLKSAAIQIPLNLSKSASFKLGKQYIRNLRFAFVATKQLETMLMLCHDLSYLHSQTFIELNSKINTFSGKLWKYIRYCERKLKQKQSGN